MYYLIVAFINKNVVLTRGVKSVKSQSLIYSTVLTTMFKSGLVIIMIDLIGAYYLYLNYIKKKQLFELYTFILDVKNRIVRLVNVTILFSSHWHENTVFSRQFVDDKILL